MPALFPGPLAPALHGGACSAGGVVALPFLDSEIKALAIGPLLHGRLQRRRSAAPPYGTALRLHAGF